MIETTTRNATLEDFAFMLPGAAGTQGSTWSFPPARSTAEGGLLRITGADPLRVRGGRHLRRPGSTGPPRSATTASRASSASPAATCAACAPSAPTCGTPTLTGRLQGGPNWATGGTHGPDPRKFMLRAFRGDAGDSEGIARAWVSDSYRAIDNLDTLVAALDGARQAGAQITVGRCNLTDSRMYVDVLAPGITALAPRPAYRVPQPARRAARGQPGDVLRAAHRQLPRSGAAPPPSAPWRLCAAPTA